MTAKSLSHKKAVKVIQDLIGPNIQKATVKWWNDAKGYGFLTSEGKDIFCHYMAIQGDGFKTLAEDQEVLIEVRDGPKGLEAAKLYKQIV